MEEAEVIQRLSVQQDLIQELRNMVEYQVGVTLKTFIKDKKATRYNGKPFYIIQPHKYYSIKVYLIIGLVER